LAATTSQTEIATHRGKRDEVVVFTDDPFTGVALLPDDVAENAAFFSS